MDISFKVLVLLICLASLTVLCFSGCGLSTKPDLEISYITAGWTIPDEHKDAIEKHLSTYIQDTNDDGNKLVEMYPLTSTVKIDLELLSKETEIVLIDRITLKKYIEADELDPLDDYVEKYQINILENPETIASVNNSDEKHVYAIPVSFLLYLVDAGLPSNNYYFTILKITGINSNQALKNENAHLLLDGLLSEI